MMVLVGREGEGRLIYRKESAGSKLRGVGKGVKVEGSFSCSTVALVI